MTDSNPRKKNGIAAKIVKHAHRRRFQDYLRTKGRDKSTIAYVYWSMYLRSGKGNVFELAEELFLSDLGIGKNALRPARAELVKDGWLSKEAQKIDPLTGKWGTTQWIVNEESVAVASSEGVGTDAPLTGDRSPDVGSAGDRSAGDTVVLHSLYANASTSPQSATPPSDCLPHGVTSSVSSKRDSKQEPSAFSSVELSEEEDLGTIDKPEQDQNQEQPQRPQTVQEMYDGDLNAPVELLHKITPEITDAMVREQLPICEKILAHFDPVEDKYMVMAANMVLQYNRTHRSGKFASKEDKKLYIHSAAQFLKALDSPNAALMNDYWAHNFDDCEVCTKNSIWNYETLIRKIYDEEEKKERDLAAAEQAKIVAEQEQIKQARWAQYIFEVSTPEQKAKLKELRQFDLTALVQQYQVGTIQVSPSVVNATARFFADRGTPFTREEWDAVLADATEARQQQSKMAHAVGDLL